MGPKLTNPDPDAVVARVAANQHGVVSLSQLERAGIRQRGRARRLGAGRLHRIHRGVYAVGHRGLSREGQWMAPQFASALRQAEYLGLPIGPSVEPDHTRSELEGRFLTLCRRHRLRQPEVNVPLGPFTVDFLWPTGRLVVELDGYRAHAGRAAFEADRARDVELKALGYDVLRFTWQQVTVRSAHVARTVHGLLRARGQ